MLKRFGYKGNNKLVGICFDEQINLRTGQITAAMNQKYVIKPSQAKCK
jgi:hypothetical protein